MYKYVSKESIAKTIGDIYVPAMGGYSSHNAVASLDALSDGYGMDRYVNSVLSNPINDKVSSNIQVSDNSLSYYGNAQTGSDSSSGISAETAVKSISTVLNLALTSSTLNNEEIIVHIADGDYSSENSFYGRLSGQKIKIVGNINNPGSVVLPSINIFGTGLVELIGVRVAGLSVQDTTVVINSCYIDNEYVDSNNYGNNTTGYTQVIDDYIL